MFIRTLIKKRMLILSESDVRKCLDMKSCINANRKALIAISSGEANVPTRIGLQYHRRKQQESSSIVEDWSLFKPASLVVKDDNDSSIVTTTHMGMKIVSIRDENTIKYNLPLVPATVCYMDPTTGIVDAVIAATYMTAARTAACTAIAIHHHYNNINNKNNIEHVIIFGAGLQAEQHVHAILAAQNIDYISELTIINRSLQRAETLKEKLINDNLVHKCNVILLNDKDSIIQSLLNADVIITTTNTTTPLWDDDWNVILKETCIIASIGSYTPNMQEIPNNVVNQCQIIYIDTKEAVTVGDLKHLSNNDKRYQLIGQSINNNNNHRQIRTPSNSGCDDNSVVGLALYKGVGNAIEDIMTAEIVVQNAKRMNIGTEVDMS